MHSLAKDWLLEPAAAEPVAVHIASSQSVVHELHLSDLQKVIMKNTLVVSKPTFTKLFTFTGNYLTIHKRKIKQTYLGFN